MNLKTRLLDNTDAPTREAFFRTMEVIGKNLDEILKVHHLTSNQRSPSVQMG